MENQNKQKHNYLLGDLLCEIYTEETPLTAKNFIALCASDYYKNTIFHRNIKNQDEIMII